MITDEMIEQFERRLTNGGGPLLLADFRAIYTAMQQAQPLQPCSTCGATKPEQNEYCSNGFHAPGPTYWPGEDVHADEVDIDERAWKILVDHSQGKDLSNCIHMSIDSAKRAVRAALSSRPFVGADEVERVARAIVEAGAKVLAKRGVESVRLDSRTLAEAQARAAIAALSSRNDDRLLREALRPFAWAARAAGDEWVNEIPLKLDHKGLPTINLTLLDLRIARNALEAPTDKGGEE